MIPSPPSTKPDAERIPRESGDDPDAGGFANGVDVYSPRERG